MYSVASCQLLCAVDGVDQKAVDINGETALDLAINRSQVDCMRALLVLNVDTSKAHVTAQTNVEIVHLLEKHRKRPVKKYYYYYFLCLKVKLVCLLIHFMQEIERIAIRNRVLEEQRVQIQKYFKFEVVN